MTIVFVRGIDDVGVMLVVIITTAFLLLPLCNIIIPLGAANDATNSATGFEDLILLRHGSSTGAVGLIVGGIAAFSYPW